MLRKEVKEAIIEKFKKSPNDKGSCELQVALLSKRIKQISGHLGINKKDYSSRQGLITILGKRKKLLSYLKRKDFAGYTELNAKLKQEKYI